MSSSPHSVDQKENLFKEFANRIFHELHSGEHLTVSLHDESSHFTRYNHAKIRQVTEVQQSDVSLVFVSNQHEIIRGLPMTWDIDADFEAALSMLQDCRQNCLKLPENRIVLIPENNGNSRDIRVSSSIDQFTINERVLAPVQKVDFAGLLTCGITIRANMNSKGQSHWFANDSFYVDYSMYTEKQKAVKGCYAGSLWSQSAYESNVADSLNLLNKMNLPPQEISRGRYRTYLAPSAVSELINLINWGAVSGAAYKQGFCALKDLYDQKKKLSPKFSLYEDFGMGMVPRFNNYGEVSEECIAVIDGGEAKALLVNSKTAKEYPDLKGNAAANEEWLRSPRIHTGDLQRENILQELGTGLYVSNLHYLNWSDRPNARVTGMTRFACFWVENGEICGPIKDLRFDETLYNIFGDCLRAVTDFAEIIPVTSTYERREIGGSFLPGLLIDDFSYTL